MKKIALFLFIFILILIGNAGEKYYDVELKLYAPDAKTVNVPMAINGWNRKANPMVKGDDGYFRLKLRLKPGKYPYIFLVDGKKWVLDPKAPKIKIGKYTDSLLLVGTKEEIKEAEKKLLSLKKKVLNDAKTLKGYKAFKKIKPNKPYNFVILGDNRDNPEMYKKIMEHVIKFKPLFILNTGDIVGNCNEYDEWVEFLKISKMADCPYFVSFGNHEYKGKKDFEFLKKILDFPGKKPYYYLNFGDLQIIVLSSEIPRQHSKIVGKQLKWLEKTLKKGNFKHRIVLIHRPFYPNKDKGHHYKDSLNKYPKERDYVIELFKKHGVKYIYCGHDHYYDKKQVNGIIHVITGGAGAPLYAEKDEGGHNHFIVVTVDDKGLHNTVYTLNGNNIEVIDRF